MASVFDQFDAPAAPVADNPFNAFDAEAAVPTISRAEADRLYGEAATFQPRPSGAFPAIERRLPAAAVAAAPRIQIGEEFNETTGQWEPTYAPDGEATGPIRDAVQRLKRGAMAGAGQIIQGAGRFADTRPTEDNLFAMSSRNPVERALTNFGQGVEDVALETSGINRARDNTLLAQGADMAGPLVPIIASGGYGAIPTSAFMMGEQGGRAAEARGEDAAGVKRSALINTVGGAALSAIPATIGVRTASPAISRLTQSELARRGLRAAVGAGSGGLAQAAGSTALQLYDTGSATWDRTLPDTLIGAAAGGTVGGSMRSADVPAPRLRATNELLPTLDLESARNQYNQAIELETADALRRNLELQDQRTIDAQLADQIAARELAPPPAFEPTFEGFPSSRAGRQVQLDEAFAPPPAQSARESAAVFTAAEDAMLAREAAAVDAEMASTVPDEIQLSPQAQRAADEFEGQFSGSRSRQFRNRSQGSVDTSVLRTLGGGIGGSAYGYATGETPEERLARAAAFGIGGAAVAGAGPAAIRRIASAAGDSGRPVRTNGLQLEPRPSVNADRVAELAPVYQDVVARNPDIAAGVNGYSLPVEIRLPDGTIEAAVVSGWQETNASQFGGNPGEYILRPNLGRMVNGAPSHGPLPANIELLTPIPDYAQWDAGVQGIRSRISNASGPQLETPSARTEPELAPIEEGISIEPIGMQQLVLADAGFTPEMQYQVRRPGEEGRGVTMTESQLREQGIPIPEAPAAGNAPQAALSTKAPTNAGTGQASAQNAPAVAGGGAGVNPPPASGATPLSLPAPQPSNPIPRSLYPDGEPFYNIVKRKLVDFMAPIEDTLRRAEREGGIAVTPESDIRNQVDRVLVAPRIAGQFLKDAGYFDAIRMVDDVGEFGEFLIAQHALDVGPQNMGRGYDMNRAAAVVARDAAKYGPATALVRKASIGLLSKAVQDGLISAETAAHLDDIYPNYVPIKRVFDAIDKEAASGSKAPASISRQTGIRRFEGGSERPIENPLGSFLQKAEDIFIQGERNKAARMLADYRNLPVFDELIREVPQAQQKSGNMPENTFSYLDDGVKRTFEAPKEITGAAKNLNSLTLDPVMKFISYPMRIARAGITGLNIPFALANVVRDQFTSFSNSQNAMAALREMPRALFEAVGHGKVYDEMVRQGAIQTSYDMARNNPMATVDKIRSGRSLKSKVAYTVTHPSELLRAVEDIVGRSEEVSRIQNYLGAYETAIKQGMTQERAAIVGANAARTTTANFNRRGEWGPVVNAMWLFFGAGTQGVRGRVRAIRRNPVTTLAKMGLSLAAPVALATMWNTATPKRKEAYEDIPEYERENNIILLPDDPVKDDKGRWNAIKIPITPNDGAFASPFRRSIEAYNKLDPLGAADFAKSFLGTISPVGADENSIASNAVPIAGRPLVEAYRNINLFTGQDIVPNRLQRFAPEYQYDKNTSGSSIRIGQTIGVSPMKVEHVLRGYGGGVAMQGLNAADRVASLFDDDWQVGGRSIPEDISRRFGSAAGGGIAQRFYDTNNVAGQARATYRMLMQEGRDAEAKAFYENNAPLIDSARSLERAARKNSLDTTLEGEASKVQRRERDERMKDALRSVEDRVREAEKPASKRK